MSDVNEFVKKCRQYIAWAESAISSIPPSPIDASSLAKEMDGMDLIDLSYSRDDRQDFYEAKHALERLTEALDLRYLKSDIRDVSNALDDLYSRNISATSNANRTYRTISHRSKSVYHKYRR